MPSAPSQRTSTSSRPSHGSPTFTTSSQGYAYPTQAYQMNAQRAHQGQQQSNYNPAAIHSWVQGVQQNLPRQQVNMNDPAVQAYMQAKLGLYQQAAQQGSSKKGK
ncbi:hypothetical protein KVT40_004386 [Elsinoe batatas]|uniref:Uncharacterized protein n=1 Tax=Elsinoe batatas TaxID=2601811 RepID=A0A8K0PIH8_9PEZI|nr:hypothetical protein KVT40_004386 [Elsinoe batatas]